MLATSFGGSTELDGDELIVDLTVGRIVRRGPPPGEATPDAIFSPDGRLFAWSGVKGVYAADVTGKRVYRFDVPASESPVAFSPDGRLMAAVWEGAVHVWPTPEH